MYDKTKNKEKSIQNEFFYNTLTVKKHEQIYKRYAQKSMLNKELKFLNRAVMYILIKQQRNFQKQPRNHYRNLSEREIKEKKRKWKNFIETFF